MQKSEFGRCFRGIFLFALCVFLGPVAGQAQVLDGKVLVSASLVPSQTAIVPGQPFEVGLLLEMAPDWHTYWEYSGDAGLPTKIDWALPAGFESGPIQWPAPHLMIEPGEIWTYGYGGKVLLITTIVPPADLQAGASATLRAKATWLVCKDMCIPGSAELELKLPVSKASAASNEAVFAEFRSSIPSADPPPFVLKWKQTSSGWDLAIPNLPPGAEAALFPLPS